MEREQDDGVPRPAGHADPPVLSPDGRQYWNGAEWIPLRSAKEGSKSDRSSPLKGNKSLLGWLGLALTLAAGLLTLVLLQRPVIFIGALDVALPLLLAIAGMVLAGIGGRAIKWVTWVVGALVVLLVLLVVLMLATGGSGTGGVGVG